MNFLTFLKLKNLWSNHEDKPLYEHTKLERVLWQVRSSYSTWSKGHRLPAKSKAYRDSSNWGESSNEREWQFLEKLSKKSCKNLQIYHELHHLTRSFQRDSTACFPSAQIFHQFVYWWQWRLLWELYFHKFL